MDRTFKKMTNIEEQRINSLRKTLSIIHNRAMAWIILALSLMLTVAAYLITQSQMNTRAEERFKFRALEVKQAIVARMEHYEQVLRGSVGLFNASKNVSRNEWESYVTSLGLETTLQGIQGLGYAIPVSPQDKDDVIDGVKNEGFTDFTIKPEGERAEYSTVLYLEPFDWRNKRAFGYDMWSNDMRRQAMTRARDDGVAATSGIITLVQETDSNVQKGFLTYLPVYTSKSTPDNQFERRRYFQGWVYAAFRSGNLMAGILGGSDDQIYFKIYDGEELIEDNLLFSSGKSSATYDARESASFLQKNKIQLQGRPWTIQFSSAGNNLNRSEVNQPIYVLAAGIFIDFLIFYVIFSLHLLNRRANAIASSLEVDQAEAKQRITAQYDLLDLKENEANVFFELAPEAFLMLDESAKIVKANLHAHQTFGYENPQLIGLDIEALIPESKLRAHKGLRDAYLKSPNQRMMGGDSTFSALRRDGSTIDATINLVPIQYDGKQHIVAAIHDISTQKNIERSRESAKQAAEIASRAKSEFVANMSHEIRTPLNAVLGAAQLLKKTSLSEEQNKYLGMIRHAGQSLLEVISDILDFSKIEAGHMELAESPFDLTEVFSRLATIMSVNSGNKDLDLIINISSDIPKLLIGDALRLQQILINLASNAIKFTERGQVVVEISRNDYDDEMCSLHFSIRDTGIGMSDEEQSRLFKAFTQADTSITRRFGGTGLGLVISSQLLELMGGDIKLKSQKEHGTEFYFDLNFPLVSGFSSQGEQSSKLSLPEECKSDGEFVVSQPVHHLLVVAENDEYIASVNSIGKILGWRVSVEKALDRAISVYELAKNNTPIDTVLVSADMPCSSGISFEAMLNKIDLGACHKLVLVAKNSQRGERINAAVISKPFERLIQPLT
ncbi:MAG: PAS domain S-box-containing protein, partial [Lentisphaeria bacterium]